MFLYHLNKQELKSIKVAVKRKDIPESPHAGPLLRNLENPEELVIHRMGDWPMITFSQEVCMTIAHTTRPTSGCSCNRRSLNFELAELLFNYCSYCGCELLEMSTVGHGAFAVYKIRQNQDKMLTNIHSMEQEKDQIYNEQDNTLGPMKYSSKLMNSIWGMYNRYSVHNFKKNIDGSCVGIAANQQMQSVGSAASVDKTSTDIKAAKGPTQLFPNLWAPSDYSY